MPLAANDRGAGFVMHRIFRDGRFDSLVIISWHLLFVIS